MTRFIEIADRIHLHTHPFLLVNSVLVVGGERAMLIDTLSTHAQARELAAAAAAVTTKPLTIVNTHFHYDHVFGNATFAGPDTPIFATASCARELREHGREWQRRWQREWAELDEDFALTLGQVAILPPNREVSPTAVVELGDLQVTLSHHGRGHTSGDLVIQVRDLVVAGDLIEQAAPPGFCDSYPLDWPETLAAVMRLGSTFVPGHGAVVDGDFVRDQHDELAALEWLIRDAHADGAKAEEVAAASSLARWGDVGLAEARHAVRRGYGQLDVLLDS
jgi:glyoxylase-like metal-dependent hydrolase (beta-lactamase superfamily II)